MVLFRHQPKFFVQNVAPSNEGAYQNTRKTGNDLDARAHFVPVGPKKRKSALASQDDDGEYSTFVHF